MTEQQILNELMLNAGPSTAAVVMGVMYLRSMLRSIASRLERLETDAKACRDERSLVRTEIAVLKTRGGWNGRNPGAPSHISGDLTPVDQ